MKMVCRETTKDKYIRKVILRLDYVGPSNDEKILERLNASNIFNGWLGARASHNNIKVRAAYNMDDLEQISKSASIPIEEIQKSSFYRFSKQMDDLDIFFDVSQFYICLVLQVHGQYPGLDKYMDLFASVNKEIVSCEKYVKFQRLGIRKIRQQDFNNYPALLKVFKENAFPGITEKSNDENIANDFTDIKRKKDIKIRNNRQLYKVRYTNAYDNKSIIKIQTVLDIDTYIDKVDKLNGKNFRTSSDLEKELNQEEFERYSSFMR